MVKLAMMLGLKTLKLFQTSDLGVDWSHNVLQMKVICPDLHVEQALSVGVVEEQLDVVRSMKRRLGQNDDL